MATYEESLGQLDLILSKLESDTLPIDKMAPQLERAFEIFDEVNKLLLDTQLQVEKVLNYRLNLETKSESNATHNTEIE
jgi:exodeoxyribonuclease VII small subunit